MLDKASKKHFLGRQLHITNADDTFEVECIIEEKIKSPSPFVIKLLNSHRIHKESYCSSEADFYLLFEEPLWTLQSEISRRQSERKPFQPKEIEEVITRVAKGLKYLYGINHHHLKMTASAITWPISEGRQVQLIDEWVLGKQHEVDASKSISPDELHSEQ